MLEGLDSTLKTTANHLMILLLHGSYVTPFGKFPLEGRVAESGYWPGRPANHDGSRRRRDVVRVLSSGSAR